MALQNMEMMHYKIMGFSGVYELDRATALYV